MTVSEPTHTSNMQLLLFIVCVVEGWGVPVYSGSVGRVGAGERELPLHRARPAHPDRPGDRLQERETEHMLWDLYQDKLRPSPARRQYNTQPSYRKRQKKTRFTLGSSEEERYGKTLLYWRGKSQTPGGFWEPYVYDPTAGYEPYWINGDWVIKSENVTTTLGPNCPYADCPEAFANFGPVCASDATMKTFSFNSYCDMMLDDCDGGKEYTVSYRGYCAPAGLKVFQTDFKHEFLPDEMWDKANNYVADWFGRSPTTWTYTHFPTTTTRATRAPNGPPVGR